MKSPRVFLRPAFAAWLTLGFVAAQAALAQYAIDWSSMDGGGATSTGGVYSVSGTIGQPDANASTLTGGNYALTGGFWSLYAVQTPGAPWLKIFLTSTNTAVVCWPSPSTGWNLRQNADLTGTNWVAPSEGILDDGTNRFIIVAPPAGDRYFRLANP